ncbi:hypothetical protein NBRC116494_14170 [Aurantivibrio plasticivorans]
MKFPDFLEFEPFNQIRQTMGATKLGAFEFFDAKVQLSAYERMALQKGLVIAASELRVLPDKTLAWKNARVIAMAVEGQPTVTQYHLAGCEIFDEIAGGVTSLTVATDAPHTSDSVVQVCEQCLHTLNYSGFDAVRARHQRYAQHVLQTFKLSEYFKAYPSYPITEKKTSLLF